MVIATTGDPVIRMHRNVGEGARAAASSLLTVSGVGLRPGHARILENALGETRRVLMQLAHVGDVGAGGAGALGDQDRENAGLYGWNAPERQVKGEWHRPTRVI